MQVNTRKGTFVQRLREIHHIGELGLSLYCPKI